jgi:hypothetical protein
MKQFLITAATTIAMVLAALYVKEYLDKRKAAKQLASADTSATA